MPETETYEPFVWKGEPLDTIGKLLDAVAACATPEEATRFMEAYRATTPHADQNIGYVAGYADQKTCERILSWTGTHFGRAQAMSSMKKAVEEHRG